MTCLVPLELAGFDGSEKVFFWRNPRPSSTYYCRPIRFRFCKETKEVLDEEESYLENSIKDLVPTEIDEGCWTIRPIIELTMIDGKVATALSDVTNSTMCCPVCGCKPSDMNRIEEATQRPISSESIRHGLSTLHAWIRSMECFLHISYKLDLKKWRIPKSEQPAVKKRKARIQKQLRDRLGLIVDMPRPGGSGTSNDGNTARRFFQNPQIADILELDEKLIEKMHVVLQTLSAGFAIDADKFETFCREVAHLYVEKYDWYNMPQSLHRILIHGHQVVRRMTLPIVFLSEEALEARNKDFKKFRERFTRKAKRNYTNEDIFRRLICSSDPIISSYRKPKFGHTRTSFSSEAIALFKEPNLLHHLDL